MPASSSYGPVAVLVLLAGAITGAILLLAHLIGPKRHGPIKDSTYESGVTPVGTARQRFHVRFYLVAMLFLLFDVEIVFIYPWATLLPRLRGEQAEHAGWAAQMVQNGFGVGFFLSSMAFFVGVLLVGYVYAWRKGVFRWD